MVCRWSIFLLLKLNLSALVCSCECERPLGNLGVLTSKICLYSFLYTRKCVVDIKSIIQMIFAAGTVI